MPNYLYWIVIHKNGHEEWIQCDHFEGLYTKDKQSVAIYSDKNIKQFTGEMGALFWRKLFQAMQSGKKIIHLNHSD